jgi:RNA-splicing ligase RtcB
VSIRRMRKRGLPPTGEVYPGDEADVSRFFGDGENSREGNWKLMQLCRQVERAATLALEGEWVGDALLGAAVASVEPAPDAGSPEGADYLADMAWAVDYVEWGRRTMVAAVCEVLKGILGSDPDDGSYISCNHNHIRRENHEGETLWVHRKGAISAAAGEPGVVPGSMGTHSFHVEGRGCAAALCSSAHGAGRRLSRTDARRRLSAKDVTRELRGVWFDHRLAAGLREEAPSAYKDIDVVLRAEHDLVRITRRLRPVLCFKGV